MFAFKGYPAPYQIIPPEDSDESDESHENKALPWTRRSLRRSTNSRSASSKPWKRIVIVVISIFGTISVGTALIELGHWAGYRQGLEAGKPEVSPGCHDSHPQTTTTDHPNKHHMAPADGHVVRKCKDPVLRREWRSLSTQHKTSYLDAVICLAETPSVLRDSGTVYDDFPWVHFQMANTTHGGASFLSWHRRFIHVYEQYLKKLCGYQGTLPYWDWTLDWVDLSQSPAFSPTLGFGGDGDPLSAETVGGGRCVTSGPLAGRLRPLVYGSRSGEHCLSRGFTFNSKPIDKLSPDTVEMALQERDYGSFLLALENGPHNAIPNAVKGDFNSFTAPYDPLSYLHHAQLDRLWLKWQQRDPENRFTEYTKMSKDMKEPRLKDSIWMGGLEYHGEVTVEDIMDPENGDLCYRYT